MDIIDLRNSMNNLCETLGIPPLIGVEEPIYKEEKKACLNL